MPGRLASAHLLRRRASVRVVTLAAAVLVAASCGGDDFQYLSNQDAHLFFRLPDDWRVFGQEELFEAQMDAGVGFPAADDLRRRVWMRGFDASGDAEAVDVLQLGGDHPRGLAEVRALNASERDTMSLAALRRVGGVDPLEAGQTPGSGVQVLDLEEISEGDARGFRIVVSITSESRTIVVTQLALVDAGTTRLYRLSLGCSASCYDDNRSLVEEVTESWTVEET
jgi:hypothetical protein